MAQIIKHRRGSIASLKGTTARNGELIIASGSISNLNGPFVFVGSPNSSDEGVAGAFNTISKIYQGSSAPTLTAGTYGSMLDGTPFYATGDKSLYTLNNDGAGGNNRLDLSGNLEGKTISGMTITSLTGSLFGNSSTATSASYASNVPFSGLIGTPSGIISGSGQVTLSSTTGYSTFSSSIATTDAAQDTKISGLETASGSIRTDFNSYTSSNDTTNTTQNGRLTSLEGVTGSISFLNTSTGSIIALNTYTGSNDTLNTTQNGRLTSLETASGSIRTDFNSYTGSNDTLNTTQNGRLTSIEGVTGSIGALNTYTGSNDTLNTTQNSRLTAIETSTGSLNTFTSSINTTIKTKLNTEGVISGSSQVLNGSGIWSGSAQLPTGVVSGSSQINGSTLNNITLTNVVATGSFSGSFKGDGSALTGLVTELDVAGDSGTGTIDLLTQSLTVGGTSNEIVTSVAGQTITIGLPNDVTIGQNLTVTSNTNVGGDMAVTGALNVDGNTSLTGDLYISGTLQVLGGSTSVVIQSTTIELDDNIIKLNAYSPFQRYAGFEVNDSGSSGVSASMVWDSLNDYWMFVSASGQSSKLIGTTAGTYGSEASLTVNSISKATGANTIGDSLIGDDGTTLTYNTNKFTVASSNGATLIAGNVTLSSSGGSDAGTKTSAITFRNSSNVLGYVSTTETTDVLDGILGYKHSDGGLTFSTVIDGGSF